MQGHDLEYYVDRLTRPFQVHVLQRTEALSEIDASASVEVERKASARIRSAEHDGLIKQLREAVVGGIGSHAGGGGAGSERLPFDDGARELYDSIEDEVSAWYVRLTEMPVHLLPERTLRGLHLVLLQGAEGPRDLLLRRTERWSKAIEALFDPPKTREFTEPCPHCGERWAFEAKTGNRIPALVFRYREESPDAAAHVISAECRFDPFVWEGEAEVEQLVALLTPATENEEEKTDAE